MSPIGGEGCTARRAGRPTWRVPESAEWLERASRDGDQHTLTANGRRLAGWSGRVFSKHRVRIVGRRFRLVVNADGASYPMMLVGMVLGKIVSAVCNAASPVDRELALAHVVADPIKAHIHCF